MEKLSVIIPAYNEEAVIESFYSRLVEVMNPLPMEIEMIFVNDGSDDKTVEILMQLRNQDKRIGILDLSRNFGKEIALTAGLDHAAGDVVVVIDADLQDPPELIPEMLSTWQQGYDIVCAKRRQRQGESALKKATAYAFYRIIQKLSTTKIPTDTGDYRLLSRRAIDSLASIREQHRFMKGLFVWIGFPQTHILYDRDPRFSGATKWNYWKLWNFAIEGITSFSIVPLKLASYCGLLTSLCAFFYALFIIIKTLLFGEVVQGYPSLMVVILFLGGLQLLFLGIIGEYLGRVFNETKNRPLYFIQGYDPSSIQASK